MGIAERKEREKQQKRNLILDCAEKLFFSKGFAGTSVDDIAKEAEYSKGTIYLYFKSKEEIIANINLRGKSILYSMFRQYIATSPNGIEKLKKIGEANFDFMNKYPDYCYVMQVFDNLEIDSSNINPELLLANGEGKKIMEIMIESIIEGQSDGSICQDLNPMKTAHILAGTSSGIFNWITKMKSSNMIDDAKATDKLSSDDLFEEYFEFVYKAMKP